MTPVTIKKMMRDAIWFMVNEIRYIVVAQWLIRRDGVWIRNNGICNVEFISALEEEKVKMRLAIG